MLQPKKIQSVSLQTPDGIPLYAAGPSVDKGEMILSPSIGHLGHGTGPETFKTGADWLSEMLQLGST